jgi:cell division control protein 6
VARILIAEETLDPSFLPPRLVHRDMELEVLLGRYRASLEKGVPYHMLLTGGVGSGKTAIANRLARDLLAAGSTGASRAGRRALRTHYVNCWRRSSDRTVMLELLRMAGVSLPDRGYALPEMLDVFEQGLRKDPAYRLIILDEAGALLRQETKLVYLLTRALEVGLGTISLLLVAPEDVLPYLDAASRSSFGVTHRLQLARYDADALAEIIAYRASIALRPGAIAPDVVRQLAELASGSGDARFALELLEGAARTAEEAGAESVEPEHVRAAKGSLFPTLTESKLESLSEPELLILLGLSRTLRGPRTRSPTDRAREAYAVVAAEHDRPPVSRVTFWRHVRTLEREGIVQVEPASSGKPARLGMDEVPASFLATLLEERLSSRRPHKN